jgi:hypothetical protein
VHISSKALQYSLPYILSPIPKRAELNYAMQTRWLTSTEVSEFNVGFSVADIDFPHERMARIDSIVLRRRLNGRGDQEIIPKSSQVRVIYIRRVMHKAGHNREQSGQIPLVAATIKFVWDAHTNESHPP